MGTANMKTNKPEPKEDPEELIPVPGGFIKRGIPGKYKRYGGCMFTVDANGDIKGHGVKLEEMVMLELKGEPKCKRAPGVM